MRNTRDSSKALCRIAFSCCADAKSRPNGFSTITRAPRVQSARCELLDDRAEQRRRDREVVRGMDGAVELAAQRGERRRVGVVAVDVAQQRQELRERRLVDAAVLREAVARPRAELVEVPARLRDADDGHVEVPAPDHRLQRREDLLVREIAGGAEEHERVGLHGAGGGHRVAVPGESDSGKAGSSTTEGHEGREERKRLRRALPAFFVALRGLRALRGSRFRRRSLGNYFAGFSTWPPNS